MKGRELPFTRTPAIFTDSPVMFTATVVCDTLWSKNRYFIASEYATATSLLMSSAILMPKLEPEAGCLPHKVSRKQNDAAAGLKPRDG